MSRTKWYDSRHIIRHARLSKKRIRNPTFPYRAYRPVVLRITPRRRDLPLPRSTAAPKQPVATDRGGETNRRELESDDGRTRSERRCLVTRTEQFGYVGTWSRFSSSLLSTCGHSITFLPAYDCRSRFAVRIIIILFIVFAYYNNSTRHIDSKRYKVPTIIQLPSRYIGTQPTRPRQIRINFYIEFTL
jgi:hypothetical protein